MYKTVISSDDLQRVLGESVVFDTRFNLSDTDRGHADFLATRIPSAVYAHLNNDLSGPIVPGVSGRHPLPKIEDFEAFLKASGVSVDSQVVVYDQKNGAIAARMWWMLKWLGHENVAVLDGGWEKWVMEGREMESASLQPVLAGDFQARADAKMIANYQDVRAKISGEGAAIFDARAYSRFAGENEPIDRVAGHIPGAVSKPFADNLRSDGTMKSRSELADRFSDATQDSIFYCGSGVTACHNILAMESAGLGRAKLYPGSWSEWINYEYPAQKKGG